MLRTTFTAITLAACVALAGCAGGLPETVDDGELQQPTTSAAIEVPTVPVFFGVDNYLLVTDDQPWVYGRFDLVRGGKVLIQLQKDAGAEPGPVGFKLYGVKANGKLRYLATIDGPHGWAGATLRSTAGGTYVVEVVGDPHPAGLIVGLTCRSAQCSPLRQPGDTCDGIAALRCADGLVCLHAAGSCGWADAAGTCAVPPEMCPRYWAPVCGCDGVTYGNPCEALQAGATVDYEGACGSHAEGELCGGIAGFQCRPGLACQYPDGSCHWADAAGVCVTRPDACAQVYDPVCGCDGQTYGNACMALQAGVTIDGAGACTSGQGAGETCGGIAALECAAGLACQYPVGTCGWGDPSGVCVARPDACAQMYDPVCGCDGQTYSNACMALQAGARVDHAGGC